MDMARVASKHQQDQPQQQRQQGVGRGHNLIPNRPGEPPRGGREKGTPNAITRLLKEAAMVGWAAAGDHLMELAVIEEEEAIEEASKAAAMRQDGKVPPEQQKAVRLAKLFARRPGGLEGFLAYAAIKDIRGTLNMMGRVLPLQLHQTGSTTVDVNNQTGSVTVKHKMTIDEMEEQLKARGLPPLMGRLIDHVPMRVINPQADDPNPMRTQEDMGIRHENTMQTGEEDEDL